MKNLVKITYERSNSMTGKTQLDIIRENVEKQIGSKIKIVSKRGKRQIVTKNGVITHAYPGVFVVKVYENNNRESYASYSYSDILTKTVRLTLAN